MSKAVHADAIFGCSNETSHRGSMYTQSRQLAGIQYCVIGILELSGKLRMFPVDSRINDRNLYSLSGKARSIGAGSNHGSQAPASLVFRGFEVFRNRSRWERGGAGSSGSGSGLSLKAFLSEPRLLLASTARATPATTASPGRFSAALELDEVVPSDVAVPSSVGRIPVGASGGVARCSSTSAAMLSER